MPRSGGLQLLSATCYVAQCPGAFALGLQIMAALAVMAVALALHLQNQPYEEKQVSQLEVQPG